MNVLWTTLIQVLLLSCSLLAEENAADDDDPETFPERLRSAMLRASWQSEPIPVVPLPQGVQNQEGNHPQPGIPPPPPTDNDDDIDDRQPPLPPPILPPPTEEESTDVPDTNVGGNYWYYTDTQQTEPSTANYNWWSYTTRPPPTRQTEPSTAAYNWWSYTTRQPYIETATQPANNYWYNYYTTRKPTTFSWINWNSFTLPPTTMKYYWQAPAAGSPDDVTETGSTIHQNLESVSTEDTPISATSKLKPMASLHNFSYNSESKFTRPSKDSWKFWDNHPKSTVKYSWYSSGDDVRSSSTEFPWKYTNKIDTHKVNAWSSEITTNAPEASSLHTVSETLHSVTTDRTSVSSELLPEVTTRPQSSWLESKSNITQRPFHTRYIWSLISGSQANTTYNSNARNDLVTEIRTKLQEKLPGVVKNYVRESGISGTLVDKTNYSVISHAKETVTSDKNGLNDSRNESENLPWKYLYNTAASLSTAKFDKETPSNYFSRLSHENQKVTTETQNIAAPKLNIPYQSIQISSNSSITRYALKPWTFWENSGKRQPNFRYYWYSPGDDWLQVKLKSSERLHDQQSKQTKDIEPLLETSSEQEVAKKFKYVLTDGSSENKKLSTGISEEPYSEFQNEASVSAKSEPTITVRPQYIGLDSKFNETHKSPLSSYFWNSTSKSQPETSYNWYSTGDVNTGALKYNKSSGSLGRYSSVYGELSTLYPEKSVNDSTSNETEIKYQHGSASQFIRNNTSNLQPKFKYVSYEKGNVSNQLGNKPYDKSNESVNKDKIISETNDTMVRQSKFKAVNSEEDKTAYFQADNRDSRIDATKSPAGGWKHWYIPRKSPESNKYIWVSSNGETSNLSTEKSQTLVELEKGHFRTVIPNSDLVRRMSAKEATSGLNNFSLNPGLNSVRSAYVSERSKSQPVTRYTWYSPADETRNLNVKPFATREELLKNSAKYITQGKSTNIFETVSEELKTLQQQHGSSDSKKIELTSYAPNTSKYLYTSSDSQSSSSVGSSADPKVSQVASIIEDVHSAPGLVNSELTVGPVSIWSNSSNTSTSKPQNKYVWYGVVKGTQK